MCNGMGGGHIQVGKSVGVPLICEECLVNHPPKDLKSYSITNWICCECDCHATNKSNPIDKSNINKVSEH